MLSVALAALAFSAAPAAQQPPPDEESAPIIVQGDRDRDEKIKAFIKALTPAPIRGQLSRFESPICPSVRGIADQQSKQVEERIREVAAAAGAPVARPGCTTNLVVFITDDKPALLRQLAQRGMFPEDWSGSRIADFERDPSPVAAWQTEEEVWQDGHEIGDEDRSAPENQMSGGGGQQKGEQRGHILASAHAVATRLKPSARLAFAKAMLVAKFDALAGLTPTQLADYIAMRTLVHTDPQEMKGQTGTILTIFDAPKGTSLPPSMTAWDLSFLKAFYASSLNRYAEYQRAQMRGLMQRELDREQAEQQKQ